MFRGDKEIIMKLAAFTMATIGDELLLDLLIKHNLKSFDKMYVLNHQLSEVKRNKLMKRKNVSVIDVKLDPDFGFHEWFRQCVINCQKRLLKEYDWVLYSDSDEIVVADPEKYCNLREFIKRLNVDDGVRPRREKVDYVYCQGYDVRHVRKEEPPLNLEKKLLQQRKYWYRHYPYNKPLLSRVPLEWVVGLHKVGKESDDEQRDRFHTDLYLIHLKWLDWELCQPRLNRTMDVTSAERNFDTYPRPLTLIPERFKKII